MKQAAGALAALIVLGTVPSSQAAEEGRIQRGRTFVNLHCANCHAIGRVGASPLREAPAFRDLHKKYPVDNLAEAFADGIVTGHPSMPEFRLEPDQIDNLLAYLKSVQR